MSRYGDLVIDLTLRGTLLLQDVNLTQRQIQWAIGLFFGGLLFFLVNIEHPATQNFDEFHYVPSAKQFLSMTKNQNYEHPPLGKLVMAASIALFGDEPLGWRFMSTVFGALTLSGMFVWGLALFGNTSIALWIALITLVNQLLYVQSRIGMLDTPMMAFLTWGMAAFFFVFKNVQPEVSKKAAKKLSAIEAAPYWVHLFGGAMFGLALACKWYTLFVWAAVGALIAWHVLIAKKSAIPGLDFKKMILAWVIVPLACYYSTFWPFLWIKDDPHSVWDILGPMQYRMYDGQMRVVNSHPYMSHWWDWPILKRPIWYAFDKDKSDSNFVRGVLLLGNPAIMWCGVLAWISSCFYWFSNRTRESFLCAFTFAAFFFCWVVIPRKVAFYYYYYPAGMSLTLCLAHQLFRDSFDNPKYARYFLWTFTAVAIGLFIYFFPILAALKIPSDAYQKYMWNLGFNQWI